METKYTLKTSFIVIGHGIFETAYIEILSTNPEIVQ